MLVLSRKLGEKIRVGEEITLTVLDVQGTRVRLGIEAPPEVQIRRQELRARLEQAAPVPVACPATD